MSSKHKDNPKQNEPTSTVTASDRGVAAGRDLKGNFFTGDLWHSVVNIYNTSSKAMRLSLTFLVTGVALLLGSELVGRLPKPLGPMTGLFNIAVAEFGRIDEQGQVVSWEDGGQLGESIFVRVQDELSAIPNLNGIVQVRHQDVGLVQGTSTAERKEAARQLAEKIKAHLVIYGNLEKRGNETVFVPEFYITELKSAEELVGSDQLGTPIATPSVLQRLGRELKLSDALKSRTQALVVFTLGLAYLKLGEYDKAVDLFEQTAKTEGWKDSDGKEVLYLFLGTAYINRGKDSDITRARDAYSKSASLNPEYSRAYIGLGNLAYGDFVRSGHKDATKLDEAIAEYEKARTAKIKPATAYVEAKVHVSLGNVFVVKAQLGQTDLFAKAESEFQPVVTEYEQRNKQLKAIAAIAYFGLGTVYERGAQDYIRAAEFYRKSAATVEDDKDLQQRAETQLRIVEALMSATPTPSAQPTEMSTPTPTWTPTPTPTVIVLPTRAAAQPTPTWTRTPTPTRLPIRTLTPTRTVIVPPTPTVTPKPPTPTVIVPPTSQPTQEPSPTPTVIVPPPGTPTQEPSPTPTVIVPPTPMPTPKPPTPTWTAIAPPPTRIP